VTRAEEARLRRAAEDLARGLLGGAAGAGAGGGDAPPPPAPDAAGGNASPEASEETRETEARAPSADWSGGEEAVESPEDEGLASGATGSELLLSEEEEEGDALSSELLSEEEEEVDPEEEVGPAGEEDGEEENEEGEEEGGDPEEAAPGEPLEEPGVPPAPKSGRPARTCSHCRAPGHDRRVCPELRGRPAAAAAAAGRLSSGPGTSERKRKLASLASAGAVRRSGRARAPVMRLGAFASEAEVNDSVSGRKRQAAAADGAPAPGGKAKRARGPAEEGQPAEKKRGRKPKKPDVKALPCRALKPEKAAWAREVMEQKVAEELGLAWRAPGGGKRGALAKDALLMSVVLREHRKFTEVPAAPKRRRMVGPRGGAAAAGPSSPSAHFGPTAGSDVGSLWLSRVECSKAGVHGPWVGGICGSAKTGAYSIVLSGGYEGDTDDGVTFTYTGSGGRDLSGNKRAAPQTSDQVLEKGNKALAVNLWRGLPLRVIRGYKLKSRFAPPSGYRYDGLYHVVEVWPQEGPSGHVIWRYRMERVSKGQAPPCWEQPGWEEKQSATLAALEQQNGANPLIPVGTGTLGLYRGPKEEGKPGGGGEGTPPPASGEAEPDAKPEAMGGVHMVGSPSLIF